MARPRVAALLGQDGLDVVAEAPRLVAIVVLDRDRRPDDLAVHRRRQRRQAIADRHDKPFASTVATRGLSVANDGLARQVGRPDAVPRSARR